MIARVLLVLLTLGVVACSSDDGERAVSTTTPPRDATTTLAPAKGDPAPSRCADLSSSSRADVDDTSGTYATYLMAFDADTAMVTFDVVQLLSGEDAVTAYHQDNPEDPGGPPHDYYLVNESKALRIATVREDAAVWLVRLRSTGDASLKHGTLDELPDYLADGYPEPVYWLTLADGAVIELCEQYFP